MSITFLNDPIVITSIIGGITGGFILPIPEYLSQNRIHSIIIGATGGGIGGWMATQLFTDPSVGSLFVGSILGVIVFANFLRLIWLISMFGIIEIGLGIVIFLFL